MTESDIQRLPLRRDELEVWRLGHARHRNWPVVYTLDNDRQVYVGETLNAGARLHQHLTGPTKGHLDTARVILDDTFNKSACLDLESLLIRLFAGDGKYEVLNRNDGITEADYFDRSRYRRQFEGIFERLREEGLFRGSMTEIENSDLFKLSPFKALNEDQTAAVLDIVEGLVDDLHEERSSLSVVEGQPGTGKTVVAVFIMKLLRDIANWQETEDPLADSAFAELFVPESTALLNGLRVGLVVPQQSLRSTVRSVFKRTYGLSADLVVSPFDVGESGERWDLLIVDETHRLGRRANQASGVQNKKFRDITTRLYGRDDLQRTQLDWIRTQSKHQLFLVDAEQSVRPGDLSAEALLELRDSAQRKHRRYRLRSQMRLTAGSDYLSHVEALLKGAPVSPFKDSRYELRLFDNLAEMQAAIKRRNDEVGLSRMVAGYAWPWRSKKQPAVFDIELDGVGLRWNSTATDWIASAKSVDEVGSIHTVQGYDLNYAGVIIGEDLRYDAGSGSTYADRSKYADVKGKENNPALGLVVSNEELTRYIRNIYRVLMTRGIRGTYLYVCDPYLRARISMMVWPGSTVG